MTKRKKSDTKKLVTCLAYVVVSIACCKEFFPSGRPLTTAFAAYRKTMVNWVETQAQWVWRSITLTLRFNLQEFVHQRHCVWSCASTSKKKRNIAIFAAVWFMLTVVNVLHGNTPQPMLSHTPHDAPISSRC